MNDIITQDDNLPAATPTVGNFLSVIAQAARDPNVDVQKMHGLLDVQERMMNKQAEVEFNISFNAMQEELPTITAGSRIEHKGILISNYAKYEDIDKVVRPIMARHGFNISYDSKHIGEKIVVYARLAHKGGHERNAEIPLVIEAGGAKNSVQGVGSTISYGKRYLIGMMLNLVFEGQDDDGAKAGRVPLTIEQAAQIKDLLRTTASNVPAFLKYMGVDNVDAISAADFDKAMIPLRQKEREQKVATAFPGDTP